MSSAPDVDRLIIHQFDPATPSPGGIDTCIRGICKYAPPGVSLAVVGVDAGRGPVERKLGVWEDYKIGDRTLRFLPVARLDPSEQMNRRIPHSVRLLAGIIRYRSRLPRSNFIQVHRADTAFALRNLLKRELIYFIHTQDDGITSKSSDSFWTKAASIHRSIERSVIRNANQNIVFNRQYAEEVTKLNASTMFSPTWYDPAVVKSRSSESENYQIAWVGRLEKPKDPLLAIQVFDRLIANGDGLPWKLVVVGSGSLQEDLLERVSTFPQSQNQGVVLCGRLTPREVAKKLASCRYFLMTSFPGYEGYPRVLVEAMAAGLVPVVTEGCDTGHLIEDAVNGFVTDRNPENIAERLRNADTIDSARPGLAVESLSAPNVIEAIFKGGV
ncbi:glycosyltransferase family 4 protein [Rhodococcoides fascians]|uniref:glycosyltransferase family 4 protein n=1 Tax=Rhodococcoides fascians TaxID=1828 RepID=UPI0024BABF66|nr:glycosyltransferase [Rhodococcus fascians]MDJ0467308.1 glycosyltransferase [Rhodococcus fascians]